MRGRPKPSMAQKQAAAKVLPSVKQIIYPMCTPNGVALSPDEQTLYVAESLTGRLWAFDLPEPGKIGARRVDALALPISLGRLRGEIARARTCGAWRDWDDGETARELWELAQKEGHSERTLYRAKVEMQARSVRVMLEGRRHTYWLRPGQQLPPEIPPEAVPPDLEEWLAPLRALYPPSTPLDDL